MASPSKTTKREVLQRIKARLQDRMSEYRDRIYIVIGNDLPSNLRDKTFIVIRPLGGSFNWNQMTSAGSVVAAYEGTVSIEVWKEHRLDRQGLSESVLTDDNGLLDLEQQIVSALIGSLLESTADPYGGILTTELMPVSDGDPMRNHDESFGGGEPSTVGCRCVQAISFATNYFWDLT